MASRCNPCQGWLLLSKTVVRRRHVENVGLHPKPSAPASRLWHPSPALILADLNVMTLPTRPPSKSHAMPLDKSVCMSLSIAIS
jgi:hypothetical protein